MRIPRRLKFEGHVYDVVWVDGDDFKDEKDFITYADVDKSELKVRLRKRMKRSVIEESLFHEIVHICDNETHPMPHELVDDLARRLYAILKTNNFLRVK